MKQDRTFLDFCKTLYAPVVYFIIFAMGLRYAYYNIFAQFQPWDDEGTMMLRVSMLIKDPGAYDSLSGVYGPFYYLHKYALHTWLQLPVSHDVNRLTTIVLWGLTAAACAVFVHRLSRSVTLAAIVQMQLILHLRAFIGEPGHPHEIALLVISAALMFSSFVVSRPGASLGMIGVGVATGALLLVKINLGAGLAASVALAVLLALPRSALVTGIGGLGAVAGLMLPAALMWRHLGTPWGRNYCALVTLVIGASLVAGARSTRGNELRWRDVGVAAGSTMVAVACIFGAVLAWGNPPVAIANSVILRAAKFSSTFVIPAPIADEVVAASVASLLLATCYAFGARSIRRRESARLFVACVKLLYGCFAFYSLSQLGPGLLRYTIPVPFLWLVLVRTDAEGVDCQRFPRLLLCLLAAFQLLQAYPVHGSQATWAVFLIAPLAAVCVADASRTVLEIAGHYVRDDEGRRRTRWLPAGVALLILLTACGVYYRKADIAGLKAAYLRLTPLALPGASRLRLPPNDVAQFQWLAKNVRARCDGFVGMPGFGSLYFWTQIAPPASMNGAWILNLEDDYQRVIVEKMQTYKTPCVVHNPSIVGFWMGGRSPDPAEPLVGYIQSHFTPGPRFGAYTILLGGDRSRGLQDDASRG